MGKAWQGTALLKGCLPGYGPVAVTFPGRARPGGAFYSTSPVNPFMVLGIPYDATLDEIKFAYKKMAMRYHPDRPTGDVAKMRQLTEAYEELINSGGFSATYTFWSKSAYRAARAKYQSRWANPEHTAWQRRAYGSHSEAGTSTGRAADGGEGKAGATGERDSEQSGFHEWYKRQHFKFDTDFSDEQAAYDYFGWGGRDRSWWKEQTSAEKQAEQRDKQLKARLNLKDPHGLKTNRIILGVGAADGTLKNW